jgi:hypothetical protein
MLPVTEISREPKMCGATGNSMLMAVLGEWLQLYSWIVLSSFFFSLEVAGKLMYIV